VSEPITFLDAVVEALLRAGSYNRNDQVCPAAVLWPDKERQWEPLLPRLRERLPLLTFGPYAPAQHQGPAYWLRCMIAHTLAGDALPSEQTPVIYLPGVSRQELRAVEECPKALQPLAELQYRGVLWTHRNGRDWTIVAFLQSRDDGLGVEVASNGATREALLRALTKLADEPIAHLRKIAPLRAAFFDALLNPDEVRNLLLWLNDPEGYPKRCAPDEWAAFRNLCRQKYRLDPEKDGPVAGAERLGKGESPWDLVWARFTEAPAAYPNLPYLLRRAAPPQLSLLEPRPTWPQYNEEAEVRLQDALMALRNKSAGDARSAIGQLEQEHSQRRESVWAALGDAPLVLALEHLHRLAQATETPLGGTTVAEMAARYATHGWHADAAVLDALARVEQPQDVATVKWAIASLYRPWLETAANAWQELLMAGDPSAVYAVDGPPVAEAGTCLLFSDALRFDVSRRLVAELERRGLACQVAWRLAAIPGVTATAKPAVMPIAHLLAGGPGLEPVVQANDSRAVAETLRRLLKEGGYQVLADDEVGDPSGRGWTELGDIDTYGHEHGWKVAHRIAEEIRALVSRVGSLLDRGWKQVTIVTDHGWLLLPSGLPKAELAEHLTEIRKGRCARLKAFAHSDEQSLPWHWDKSVRIALARGIHCYEAGKEWEHGGLSPQECVVPVITVSRPASGTAQPLHIQEVAWKGLRCTVKVGGATPGMQVDIRTKAGDPATSLVKAAKELDADGRVSLVVPNEDHSGQAAMIVILGAGGMVAAQTHTTIGGD